MTKACTTKFFLRVLVFSGAVITCGILLSSTPGNTLLSEPVLSVPEDSPEEVGNKESDLDLDFSLDFSFDTIPQAFSTEFLERKEPEKEEPPKAVPEAKAKTKERPYRTRVVKATAYCPCKICCGRMTGLTKMETNAWKPGVAVDPRYIPLGSHLDIPGYPRNNGVWILADDTGSAVKGWHIDVRFQYHWQAVQWGVKYIKVRIHDPE